jgi:hypothetical protein
MDRWKGDVFWSLQTHPDFTSLNGRSLRDLGYKYLPSLDLFRYLWISYNILYTFLCTKKQTHSNSTSLLLCCLQSLNPLSSPHDLQSHFVTLGFTALVDYKLRESLAVESLAHFSKARKSEKIREKWYSYIMLMLQESLPTEFLHVAGSSAWPALAGFIEIRLAAITKWTVTFYQLLPVR